VVSQHQLGVLYSSGNGIDLDASEALKWYALAASQGHTKAQTRMGVYNFNGLGGLEKDIKAAVKWFRLAAEQGEPEASGERSKAYDRMHASPTMTTLRPPQVHYGNCFKLGHGVVKEEKEALGAIQMHVGVAD
jgi:TPR repeat protein